MAKLTAKIDTGSEADKILRGAASLRDQLRAVMSDVADDAELVFAAYALKGSTGKLSRGISTRPAGGGLMVTAHAQSASGYDYVGVTRFGHRGQWIVPRHAPKADRFFPKTAKAFPVNGGFYSSIKGFAALSTPFGYRRRVRGFHPKTDWVRDALPQIHSEAERRLGEFGRGFMVKLS